MKPRQTASIVKPASKHIETACSPTRRQTPRLIDAKAVSPGFPSGREAKDLKASSSSATSAGDAKAAGTSNDWEQSEHEGLLTMMDGRKRWFHCTK
jgi:hypothetical protein